MRSGLRDCQILMPLLIALEGIDGAGTTTQSTRLGQWMTAQGLPVHVTREPSQGRVGQLLRDVLRGEAPADGKTSALLFAADRLDHIAREIEPMLRLGRHVVTDRYVLSSLAYQSAECDSAWVETLNCFAAPANITLLLRVTPEVAQTRRMRAGRSHERFDAIELQRQIARNYDRFAPRCGAIVVDGEQSQECVLETIVTHVRSLL